VSPGPEPPSAAVAGRPGPTHVEVTRDVLEGDPTVRRLERAYAEWVGKDGALYLPSGTMAKFSSIASTACR
jgi:threonine aldolase